MMSLHVMVSCDSLHGRLIKFAKKTGRKVGPFAQTSTWIKPWTSRDEDQQRQLERDIRASCNDLCAQLGPSSMETLQKVYDLVNQALDAVNPHQQ